MSFSLVKAWTMARAKLEAAQIEQPVIDARLMLEAAAGASRTDIITDPHRPLTETQLAILETYVERRCRREPVSHILGRKGFWKVMLSVNAHVLSPRPDTETIVERALVAFPEGRAFSILDLGVGSGAILLAILAERSAAKGLGVDRSAEAIAVARDNAASLGLERRCAFLRGDWTAGLEDLRFDLVVSNPPYIPTDEIETLEPEVRDHEPRIALDGGPDGLDAYRHLAPGIMRVLKPGGVFFVEIGPGQSSAVEALFQDAGAAEVHTIKDLSDRLRVVTGIKFPFENLA